MSKNVEIETVPYVKPSPKTMAKVIDDGNGHIEIKTSLINKKNTHITNYQKLDKYSYVDKTTGEIHYYKKGKLRTNNMANLRETFESLRWVINCNIQGKDNEKFITIAYAEVEKNTEKIYYDFKAFMRKVGKYLDGDYVYIRIYEPNDEKRGGFHIHLLLIDNRDALKRKEKPLTSELLYNYWGKGYVYLENIDSLEGVTNLGVYLTARFTHDFTEGEDGKSKNVKKNSRLHLYPPNLKIYECSRTGIKRPTIEYKEHGEAMKSVAGLTKTWQQSKVIKDSNGTVLNIVTREQYNAHI